MKKVGLSASLWIFGVIFCSFVALGDTWTDPETGIVWTYTITDGKATVGGGDSSTRAIPQGTSGSIVIPEVLGGAPVSAISAYAFYYSWNITSVKMPDTIETIGMYAFAYCNNLKDITWSQGLKDIGQDAFYNDADLSITFLPPAVTNIGSSAFCCCYKLKTIVFGDSLRRIGSSAFNYCKELEDVDFGKGVATIGNGAFQSCIKLSSVILPSSITRIEDSVFSNCSNLRSVFFEGNAPSAPYAYSGAPSSLVSYVRNGSTGWVSSGSAQLPSRWPSSDSYYGRPIASYSGSRHVVNFDLGANGVSTNGPVAQIVANGYAAQAPIVQAADGWRFLKWDVDFSSVTADMVVNAVYEKLPGVSISDALDNATLPFFRGDGESVWEIVDDPTAQGGMCLKCGPLQAGQSATIKTQVPAGRGVLFYKTRFNSTSWGGTDFNVWTKNCGHGTSKSTSWYENSCSLSASDGGEVSFKLQLYSGYSPDGQICWLDDVKWLSIDEVLGKGLEFDIDDGWSIQTENQYYRASQQIIRYVGIHQLQAGEEKCISTVFEGPGILRFRHYGSIYYQGYQYSVELDGNVAILKSSEDSFYGSTYWDWKTEEIPVLTKGSHEIRWIVSNSSQSYVYGNVGICDVEWIPAPAEITIEFDGEGGRIGGESRKSVSYQTGEKYGILPVPVREGQTFEGWFTSDGKRVVSSDYVMPGVTNLFARWSVKLDGLSGDVVRGNPEIYSDELGVVFSVDETDSHSYPPVSLEDNYFEVECEGAAIVSFDWVIDVELENIRLLSADITRIFTVDGEEPENLASSKSDKYLSIYYSNWDGISRNSTDLPSRLTVKTFLTPGRHVLRWSVPDIYAYSFDMSSEESCVDMRVAVENFQIIERPVANRESLFDWAKLCREYLVWKPGNLTYLEDKYSQRIAANPNDYDAHIWRALTKIARLGENEKAREIISRCGYAVADYTFNPVGGFVGFSRAPLSNDVIDEMTPEILAALGSALDDVKVIPENWNGRVQIHPEDFGSTVVSNSAWNGEAVYYGLAEVSLLRASIEGALAAVKLARGYDYAADYIAISNACENARAHGYSRIYEAMEVAPKVGSIRKPAELIAAKEDFRAALNSIKRADQAVWNRDDYKTYILEYDLEDREEIVEARKIYDQVLASLDVTNKVDITWFVDQYDSNDVVRANAPGGLLSRDIFLGALFAGTITRDLVPDMTVDPVAVDMDTVKDFTLGGLFPDVTFSEVLSRVPFSQMWSAENYIEKGSPALLLETNQVLTLTGTAKSDGEVAFTAAADGSIVYTVDGKPDDAVSVVKGGSCSRAISARQDYSMTFTPSVALTNTAEGVAPVSVSALPTAKENGGPYKEVVDGIEWTFYVDNGNAVVGRKCAAVASETTGTVEIPTVLGGCPVTTIGSRAFMNCVDITGIIVPETIQMVEDYAFAFCEMLLSVEFKGDEPSTGLIVFMDSTRCSVLVRRSALWTVIVPGLWNQVPIAYIPSYNESLVVSADKDDWSSFVRTTSLSLSAPAGCAIYYTLDGSEPTTNSTKYVAPIVLDESKRVSYFAFETETGDWGPVDSLVLLRASGEDTSLVVTPNEKDGARFLEPQEVSFAESDGKTVWYTLDGSDPRTSGTRTKYEGPFEMNETATVRYYAVDDVTGDWGEVKSVSYVLPSYYASLVVASDPATDATFSGSTTLTLSAPNGCTVHYTTDGSSVTRMSPVYSSPLVISSTTTAKFMAVKNETQDWGPVGTVILTRVPAELSSIVVTSSAEDGARFEEDKSLNVTLSAGEGQTIWYTTDGSDPMTSATRQKYTDSLSFSTRTTLKYYAVDDVTGDWSAVQTATYYQCLPNGGPYSETVDGITWVFHVVDGEACLGEVPPEYINSSRIMWGTRDGQICIYVDFEVVGTGYLAVSNSISGRVVIPDVLGSCPVVHIGAMAFCDFNYNGDSALGIRPAEVILPATVKGIGTSAFQMCQSLETISLPAGITNIGHSAFSGCSSLQDLLIPNDLMVIGDYALDDCLQLSKIVATGNAPSVGTSAFRSLSPSCVVYVNKGTTGWGTVPGTWNGLPVKYIDEAVLSETLNGFAWNYRDTGAQVILQQDASLGAAELLSGGVEIPAVMNGKAVTVLGKGLLQGAANVTAVTIPETVEVIEPSVFRECTRLMSIDLPDGLTSIGDNAFRECVSLTEVTIPASVTNIGYFAFRDCLRLTNVTLLGSAPRQDLGVYMGVPAFTTISGRLGAATAIVYTEISNKTHEVTVPESWLEELAVEHGTPGGASSYQAAFAEKFGSDFKTALTKPTGKHDLKGNPLYVWQDYVAGTDPLDEEDVFTATIIMENGLPVVHWSPELTPERAAARKYTTWGATALNGTWVDVSEMSAANCQANGYQFFKVTVELK